MKLFTFAISSIVDANTGYGLSGTKRFLDNDSASGGAARPRAESGPSLFDRIRGALARGLESYRASAQERRELAQLQNMSDALLRDIGLHRGDLIAVELGTVSLQQLQQERRGERAETQEIVNTANLGRASDIEQEAANEASFQDRKCA